MTRGSSSDLRLKIAVLSPTEEGPSGRTNTEVEKSYESEQVQRYHSCVRVYSKQGQETISNETWPQIHTSPTTRWITEDHRHTRRRKKKVSLQVREVSQVSWCFTLAAEKRSPSTKGAQRDIRVKVGVPKSRRTQVRLSASISLNM